MMGALDWFFSSPPGKLLAGAFFLALAVVAFRVGLHGPDGVLGGALAAIWPVLWATPFLANWKS